jgi:hypothetical protein
MIEDNISSRLVTYLAWKPKPASGDGVDTLKEESAVHKLPNPENIKLSCEKSSGIPCCAFYNLSLSDFRGFEVPTRGLLNNYNHS